MNTYSKFCPNVFVAKCTEPHEKGETITMTTKRGAEHEVIVFNLLYERDDHYFYSIVRADGFNIQEWAQRRADKLRGYAGTAEKKGDHYYKASNKDRDFLSLGEPIKIGHHSERRHRKIIEQAHDNTRKWIEQEDKAKAYQERAAYWDGKADTINLSMPESIDYYQHKLEEEKEKHRKIKSGEVARRHSFDLTYAKKAANEADKNYQLAKRLWG